MALQRIENTPVDGSALGCMADNAIAEMEHRGTSEVETLIITALALAQMIIYWNLFDDALDHRDESIDKYMAFLDELQTFKAQDDVMLDARYNIIGSCSISSPNVCTESSRYRTETLNDGKAVDKAGKNLARQSARGLPSGWFFAEGNIASAASACAAGSYMAGNAKRRKESFDAKKVGIVKAAQAGMKSVYKASEILSYYQNATAIWQGLTDIYISGFNSAGAALGTALKGFTGGTNSTAVSTSSSWTTTSSDSAAASQLMEGTAA